MDTIFDEILAEDGSEKILVNYDVLHNYWKDKAPYELLGLHSHCRLIDEQIRELCHGDYKRAIRILYSWPRTDAKRLLAKQLTEAVNFFISANDYKDYSDFKVKPWEIAKLNDYFSLQDETAIFDYARANIEVLSKYSACIMDGPFSHFKGFLLAGGCFYPSDNIYGYYTFQANVDRLIGCNTEDVVRIILRHYQAGFYFQFSNSFSLFFGLLTDSPARCKSLSGLLEHYSCDRTVKTDRVEPEHYLTYQTRDGVKAALRSAVNYYLMRGDVKTCKLLLGILKEKKPTLPSVFSSYLDWVCEPLTGLNADCSHEQMVGVFQYLIQELNEHTLSQFPCEVSALYPSKSDKLNKALLAAGYVMTDDQRRHCGLPLRGSLSLYFNKTLENDKSSSQFFSKSEFKINSDSDNSKSSIRPMRANG